MFYVLDLIKNVVRIEMMTKYVNLWKKGMTAILLILCVAIGAVLFKAYLDGEFSSVETLQLYIAGFGLLAPFVLIAIQAMQVVIPILPGFLGCIVGAIMFGWLGGFWCNYIGISFGSFLAFLIARKFGKELVGKMFPGKRYERWALWAAESKSYTAFLFLAMLLPLFPDDFFCYFTGITKMSTRKFTTIIILGKPWCILAYSIIFSMAAR